MTKLLLEVSLTAQDRVQVRALEGMGTAVAIQLLKAIAMQMAAEYNTSPLGLLTAAHDACMQVPTEASRGIIVPN